MTVIFVCPCVPKISATHFVALNKIDISYMVCGSLFATLFHITPPSLVSSFPSDRKFSKRASWLGAGP